MMKGISKICKNVCESVESIIESLQWSPKNLRVASILVAIYQLLIAHVVMFIFLLGLINAEQTSQLLTQDISDQLEKEDYFYYGPTNKNGETMNIVRFKSAEALAKNTLIILYLASVIAGFYLLTCLGLMIGILKNRPNIMIPWLVVNFFTAIFCNSCFVIFGTKFFCENFNISREGFWFFCATNCFLDFLNWYIVHCYYRNIRQMSKLREEATIPIPCPAPNYNYTKQDNTLYSGGLKHSIINEYNYVA